MYTHTYTHPRVCITNIATRHIRVSFTFNLSNKTESITHAKNTTRMSPEHFHLYYLIVALPARYYLPLFPPLLPGFLLSHRCSSSSFFLVLALTWSSTNFRLTPGEGPRWTRTCSTNPLHRSPRTPLCAHRRRNVVLDSET